MYSTQVDLADIVQQRLDGEEADARLDLPQVIYAREAVFSVLYGDAQPDVARHCARRKIFTHPSRAFGQYLVGVLRGAPDHVEYLIEKAERDIVVEQVAHRVHEVHRRFVPLERLIQALGENAEGEPVFVPFCTHGLQPPRHGLGVAVFAAGRNLGAARCRIPRLLCPFDGCCVGHAEYSGFVVPILMHTRFVFMSPQPLPRTGGYLGLPGLRLCSRIYAVARG